VIAPVTLAGIRVETRTKQKIDQVRELCSCLQIRLQANVIALV
jgi:hypothetical protein